MDWEAVGAVGEVTGAIAVVITLVYLAIQIKANTRMTKAAIKEQRTAGFNAATYEWIRQADAFTKAFQGEALEPEESFRITLATQAVFREWEAWAYQRRIGLLDDSEWNPILENFRMVLSFPGTIEHWNQSKDTYSENLVNLIDGLLEMSGSEAPSLSTFYSDFRR
jgi:hypothetical protein